MIAVNFSCVIHFCIIFFASHFLHYFFYLLYDILIIFKENDDIEQKKIVETNSYIQNKIEEIKTENNQLDNQISQTLTTIIMIDNEPSATSTLASITLIDLSKEEKTKLYNQALCDCKIFTHITEKER